MSILSSVISITVFVITIVDQAFSWPRGLDVETITLVTIHGIHGIHSLVQEQVADLECYLDHGHSLRGGTPNRSTGIRYYKEPAVPALKLLEHGCYTKEMFTPSHLLVTPIFLASCVVLLSFLRPRLLKLVPSFFEPITASIASHVCRDRWPGPYLQAASLGPPRSVAAYATFET